MLDRNKILILLVFNLWAALCNAQFRVWRVDTRSPEEMAEAGAFTPWGTSFVLDVVANISMYDHATGELTVGGQGPDGRDDDGYVSTTADEARARNYLMTRFQGTGYIYEVAAAANFIQVQGTLGQFTPHAAEAEYAALGGFSWDQVIRWRQYVRGRELGGLQDNQRYMGDVYNRLRPNNGQPSLAGFPPDHEAWGLSPWNAFARALGGAGGAGCGGNGRRRRSLDSRQDSCEPIIDNESAAQRFIDENCWAVANCG
ncbi:cholera enterotoxin subunit A2 [Diaporthe helianthi]|uniref:Cholera enterotoxin subunit A2 n=1 Tax=Diaporthe helianthi TaxID=158607 RepID=A0A2P5HI33_DIAHE|nr:cholera enterotoxin subunit A2 [Diaporthe helianthi]